MSTHDYNETVGRAFRDSRPTRDDLSLEDIANFVKEKGYILSSTLWGRYKHRGRHHHLNFLQRSYAAWLLVWTPAF